ncbi:MAG: methyltransferase domain-containing protein [Bythopirellula sp.]|nr:methyltransferase domain-containing protein [Bythopirellula sp.]
MSQQGWNRLAAEFETSVCDITATSGAQIAKLVALTKPNRRKTLVDAGCGIGTFVERFGESFGKIIAFDFASAMVKRTRRRCSDFNHAEWQALPLEDAGAKFGAVAHLAVCLNVITSPKPSLRERQWVSLGQLVRPNGHLLVVVPSLESARYVAEMDEEAFHGSVDGASELVRRNDTEQKHYSRQELRRIVTHQNFEVIAVRRVSYPWEDDGLELTERKSPWDWACVARKNA